MSEAAIQQRSPSQIFREWVDRKTTEAIAALPLDVPDEGLKRARARLRVALSEDSVGRLYECSAESVGRAIVLSAISGLFPGGPAPDVWLIPRRNRHKGNELEVNWQISYRGYARLARRAGWDLEPVLVFASDDFDYEEGSEPRVRHKPDLDAPQTWETLRLGYVRVFPQDRRYTKLAILTKERIQQRRDKAKDQSIWAEWWREQVLKTLCHYAGAREMFPCDDPTRYAIAADMEAEAGGEELPKRRSVTPGTTLTSLRELVGGQEVSVEIPAPPPEPEEVAEPEAEGDAAAAEEPAPLPESGSKPAISRDGVDRVLAAVRKRGCSLEDLETQFGCKVQDLNADEEAEALRAVAELPPIEGTR